jgi:hypothetical protein
MLKVQNKLDRDRNVRNPELMPNLPSPTVKGIKLIHGNACSSIRRTSKPSFDKSC